jgi:hypothetical protein
VAWRYEQGPDTGMLDLHEQLLIRKYRNLTAAEISIKYNDQIAL